VRREERAQRHNSARRTFFCTLPTPESGSGFSRTITDLGIL
jgi:hypothetical protein